MWFGILPGTGVTTLTGGVPGVHTTGITTMVTITTAIPIITVITGTPTTTITMTTGITITTAADGTILLTFPTGLIQATINQHTHDPKPAGQVRICTPERLLQQTEGQQHVRWGIHR